MQFAQERRRFNNMIFSLLDKYMADEPSATVYYPPPSFENVETSV